MGLRSTVSVSTDASGAYNAALAGELVVIVDVIDMSTSLESALESGAVAVLGAAPDHVRCPVPTSPELIGRRAAQLAKQYQVPLVLVSEPRWAHQEERRNNASCFLAGVHRAGGCVAEIIPNAGAEVARLYPLKDTLVVAVSDTGGAAYDAAFNAGAVVTTATVARTIASKGIQPALNGARRAVTAAAAAKKNITVVAASANSWEDVLAAQCIAQLIQIEVG